MTSSNSERRSPTRRSLLCSTLDACFFDAMLALADGAALPLAVAVGAGPLGCAVTATLPLALGSVANAAYAPFMRRIRSRRSAVCVLVSLQAVALLLVAAVPWWTDGPRLLALILALSLYKSIGAAAGPIWSSLIGDIVPPRARATFFGRRSRASIVAAVLAAAAGGALLDDLTVRWSVAAAFSTVYVIAAGLRLVSAVFLRLHHDPPADSHPDVPGPAAALRALPRSRHGPLVLYLLCINAAVYVAAPYFTPYMLETLGFSYTMLAWVDNASRLTKMAFLPIWGRAADRHGARRVLSVAGPLTGVVPLLWLTHGAFAAIIAFQVFAGFVWAGFELASLALLFDATSRRDRAAVVAAYNVCNGGAFVLGTLAGMGVVAVAGSAALGYSLTFGLSGLARLASTALVPRIAEARESVSSIDSTTLLLRVLFFRPTLGLAGRPVAAPTVAPPPVAPPADMP